MLRPLGMSSTTWDADRIDDDRVARGYRLEDDAWVEEAPLADGALGAMGGLATTVRDYARYVALHLAAWPPRDDPDDGPVRRSSLREMQSIWQIGPTFMAEPTTRRRPTDGGSPTDTASGSPRGSTRRTGAWSPTAVAFRGSAHTSGGCPITGWA